MNESILDKPQESLDPSVWTEVDGNIVLTPEAIEKMQKAVDYVQGKWNFPDLSVFIIGSITSNSYSPGSDIDIDFVSPDFIAKSKAKEFGWEMKSDFIENFMEAYPEDSKVGSHPFEVFFQPNPFQCMMSVGCYNFTEKKWEIGPDVKDQGFDPIAAYYHKGMKVVKSIVNDIRNTILKTYEDALALHASEDATFKAEQSTSFYKDIADAGKLFKKMKAARTSYQREPQSKDEALKLRSDKTWHIADAAFKLLDKFGYVSILKTYCEVDDDPKMGLDIAVDKVIAAVRDNFSNNKSLNDSEKQFFIEADDELQEQLDEGLGDFAKLMALASLISIPGLIPQQALAKGFSTIPKKELRFNSVPVKNVIEKVAIDNRQYNGLSKVNLTNLVATIIYNEAMLDYKKFKDERSLIAIGNVIENRAAKDPNKFADVIKAQSQFFSASHVKGGYTDATYKMYDPHTEGHLDSTMETAWKLSAKFALQAVEGTLRNVIGRRNMIGNAKKDNAGAWKAWGKDCDLVIGSHSFGYQRDQDGYVPRKAKTYSVRAGDSLSSIAKKLKIDVKTLAAKNGIKDANKIRVGQKLKI